MRESERNQQEGNKKYFFVLCIPLYKVLLEGFFVVRRRLKIKCCALYPGSLKLYILVVQVRSSWFEDVSGTVWKWGEVNIFNHPQNNLQNVRSIPSPLPDREPRVKVSQKNALSKITSRPLSRTKVATKCF